MHKRMFILSVFLFLEGCLHVYVRDEGSEVNNRKPDYTQTVAHWAYGFGVDYVDLKKACPSGRVEQFQLTDTFGNAVVRGLTLGIYFPLTAEVWCRN